MDTRRTRLARPLVLKHPEQRCIGIRGRRDKAAMSQGEAIVGPSHVVRRAGGEDKTGVARQQDDTKAQRVQRALAALENLQALLRDEGPRKMRKKALDQPALFGSNEPFGSFRSDVRTSAVSPCLSMTPPIEWVARISSRWSL